jgi:hypothetical protein
VIADDLEISVDADSWTAVTRLFFQSGARRGRQPLVIFLDQGKVTRAIEVGGRGPVEIDWPGVAALAELRRARAAPWIVALERGALARALRRWQSEAHNAPDYVAQTLALAHALLRDPGIHVTPRPRLPPYRLVRAAFDLLLPDDHAVQLLVGDARLVLERRAGHIARITSRPPTCPVRIALSVTAPLAFSPWALIKAFLAGHLRMRVYPRDQRRWFGRAC